MGLPKILVGGVLIIDLSTLSITPSVDMETYTTISNSEILSQLERLKQYIGNPTAQKPLWVRMSYDGEMITTMGALYKEVGDPHFKLVVKVLDQRLIIDVTFTQDEETLEWYIDTGDAKYLFTSNSQEVDSYIADSISSGAIKSALNLKADLSGANFTGDITSPSIIERMSGYSFTPNTITSANVTFIYAGVVKNGNKLTFVIFGKITNHTADDIYLASFGIPSSLIPKLVPYQVGGLNVLSQAPQQFYPTSDVSSLGASATVEFTRSSVAVIVNLRKLSNITAETEYTFRIEQTFLLSENLIPEE